MRLWLVQPERHGAAAWRALRRIAPQLPRTRIVSRRLLRERSRFHSARPPSRRTGPTAVEMAEWLDEPWAIFACQLLAREEPPSRPSPPDELRHQVARGLTRLALRAPFSPKDHVLLSRPARDYPTFLVAAYAARIGCPIHWLIASAPPGGYRVDGFDRDDAERFNGRNPSWPADAELGGAPKQICVELDRLGECERMASARWDADPIALAESVRRRWPHAEVTLCGSALAGELPPWNIARLVSLGTPWSGRASLEWPTADRALLVTIGGPLAARAAQAGAPVLAAGSPWYRAYRNVWSLECGRFGVIDSHSAAWSELPVAIDQWCRTAGLAQEQVPHRTDGPVEPIETAQTGSRESPKPTGNWEPGSHPLMHHRGDNGPAPAEVS